jgi:hypothetical protein
MQGQGKGFTKDEGQGKGFTKDGEKEIEHSYK